jgi:hypothetical protein
VRRETLKVGKNSGQQSAAAAAKPATAAAVAAAAEELRRRRRVHSLAPRTKAAGQHVEEQQQDAVEDEAVLCWMASLATKRLTQQVRLYIRVETAKTFCLLLPPAPRRYYRPPRALFPRRVPCWSTTPTHPPPPPGPWSLACRSAVTWRSTTKGKAAISPWCTCCIYCLPVQMQQQHWPPCPCAFLLPLPLSCRRPAVWGFSCAQG